MPSIDYQGMDWDNEEGEFDWRAVLEAVDVEDRDEAFWDWFADQYSEG